VCLPRKSLPHLPHFFATLSEKGIVDDFLEWGISDSTLEEVFVTIVSDQRDLLSSQQGGEEACGDASFLDIDSSMASFALESWGEAVAKKKGDHQSGGARNSWLLKAVKFLRSDKGAALKPATWRPQQHKKDTTLGGNWTGDNSAHDNENDESAQPMLGRVAAERQADDPEVSKLIASANSPSHRLRDRRANSRWAREMVRGAESSSDFDDGRRKPRSSVEERWSEESDESEKKGCSSRDNTAAMSDLPATAASIPLPAVPRDASRVLQVHGIVMKSLALQRTRLCFNLSSCCFVVLTVLVTWLYALMNQVDAVSAALPQNCTHSPAAADVVVAVPNNICDEQRAVEWMSGVCPLTRASVGGHGHFDPPHVPSWQSIIRLEAQKSSNSLADPPRGDDFPSSWDRRQEVASGQEMTPRSVFFAESRGDYETSTDFGVELKYSGLFGRVFRDGWVEGRVSSDVYYDLWPVGGPVGISVCCPAESMLMMSRLRQGMACVFYNQTSLELTDVEQEVSGDVNEEEEEEEEPTLKEVVKDGRIGDFPYKNGDAWSDYFRWVKARVNAAASQTDHQTMAVTHNVRFLTNKPFEQSMSWVPATAEISPRYPILLDQRDADYQSRTPKLDTFQSTQVFQVREKIVGPNNREDELQTSTRPTATSIWFTIDRNSKKGGGDRRMVSLLDYGGLSNSSVTFIAQEEKEDKRGISSPSLRSLIWRSQVQMASRMLAESPWGTRGPKGWKNNGGYGVLSCNGLAGFAWSPNDKSWPDTRAVVVSERDNAKEEDDNGEGSSYNVSGDIGDASALFANSFPEFGLELKRSDPSTSTLHATLLFYGFGWSSGAWPYARVFAEKRCDNGEPDRCCDAHQV
jgi:hypothetical protein